MQISTIDVRTEGVDRSSGGKKGGKDDAGAESAFAAFFATHLDAQRRPEARTAEKVEADSVSEVDSAVDTKAAPRAQSKATQNVEAGSGASAEETATVAGTAQKPVQNAERVVTDKKAPATETSAPPQSDEGSQAETAAVVLLQPKHSASSAKFSVVAKDGTAATVKLNVSAAQPLVAGNAKASAPAIETAASATSAFSAPPTVVTGVAPTAATPLVPSIQTGPALVEIDPELLVTPQQAPKPDAATVGEGPKADDTKIPVEAPALVADDAGEPAEQGTGDGSARTFLEPAEKLPVSKLKSHEVTNETRPEQASDNSVNLDSVANDSATVVQTKPQDDLANEVLESIAAKPETHKADAQVVRNVTQVVSQDGSIVATRTNEVRSEHAQATGQREVVVTEKTTVQALPEQALRGARFLLNSAEQTMRIRLMPESLGEVRLEVVAVKGDVTVKLASANAAVREILQTHAPGLQHAIAQDNTGNVRVTITADVGSSAWLSSNAQRNNGQQDPNAQGQANHRSAMPSSYRETNPSTTATPRREAAHAGNLNVYV